MRKPEFVDYPNSSKKEKRGRLRGRHLHIKWLRDNPLSFGIIHCVRGH